MMDPDQPFIIESPTKIRLGPTAKEWAAEHGMSVVEMGKYLLQQQKLREQGLIQRQGEG